MIKKFLRNAWVIRIVGGILGALGLRLLDWLFIDNLLWDKTKSLFNTIVDFFNTDYVVKLYWLVLIPILTIAALILIFYIISLFNSNDNTIKKPHWYSYNRDVFDGVQYRWKYILFNDTYQIQDIETYCNNCSCLLVQETCPNCKRSYQRNSIYSGPKVKSYSEVEALILHRIENNLGVLD